MAAYLDENGLQYFKDKIKSYLGYSGDTILSVDHGGTGANNLDGIRSNVLQYASDDAIKKYLRMIDDAEVTKATGTEPISAANLAAALGIDPNATEPVPPTYVEPGKSLDSYSWQELSYMVNDPRNNGKLDYLLGQVRGVNVKGYGNVGFQVVGFKHNDLADGSGKAGMTLMAENCPFAEMWYNSSYAPNSGWTQSKIYTVLTNTFYAGFPDDIKPYIKQISLQYNSPANVSNYVNSYVFIPSEMEIFGTSNYDGSGKQYQYYSTNNTNSARVKKIGNVSCSWWLRSCYKYDSYDTFVGFVTNSGAKQNGRANYTDSSTDMYPGVVPCFCI